MIRCALHLRLVARHGMLAAACALVTCWLHRGEACLSSWLEMPSITTR